MGTDKGLVVPVLKNADELSFADIEKNIKSISDSISSKDLRNITSNLKDLVINLNSITTSLKNSEGTAGQLINDNSIYINLENATKELNILIEDIKLNPDRYINFSVFGKRNKAFKKNN